jgi:hypothetical protein
MELLSLLGKSEMVRRDHKRHSGLRPDEQTRARTVSS